MLCVHVCIGVHECMCVYCVYTLCRCVYILCVHVRVCMNVHIMQACTHAFVWICAHACNCVSCMCFHVGVYMHISAWCLCIHVSVYVSMWVRVYMYVDACTGHEHMCVNYVSACESSCECMYCVNVSCVCMCTYCMAACTNVLYMTVLCVSRLYKRFVYNHVHVCERAWICAWTSLFAFSRSCSSSSFPWKLLVP